MTPKEQAKELVFNMKIQMKGPGIEAADGNARRCALVAVEILIAECSPHTSTIGRKGISDKEYWQFVKAHI